MIRRPSCYCYLKIVQKMSRFPKVGFQRVATCPWMSRRIKARHEYFLNSDCHSRCTVYVLIGWPFKIQTTQNLDHSKSELQNVSRFQISAIRIPTLNFFHRQSLVCYTKHICLLNFIASKYVMNSGHDPSNRERFVDRTQINCSRQDFTL